VQPAVRRRPPGRYDEPSRAASRAVALLLTALAIAFAVAVVWVLYLRSTVDVPFRSVGFAPQDGAVRIDVEVTPDAGTTAWCLLRSRNGVGEEIGRVFVPVRGRSDGGTVLVQHLLPVTDEAVTGEVTRCRPTPPPAGSPTAAPTRTSP
jgi:hypothetical protein